MATKTIVRLLNGEVYTFHKFYYPEDPKKMWCYGINNERHDALYIIPISGIAIIIQQYDHKTTDRIKKERKI